MIHLPKSNYFSKDYTSEDIEIVVKKQIKFVIKKKEVYLIKGEGLVMILKILEKTDYLKLFDFEIENKVFFEKRLPPRKSGYFVWDDFNLIQDRMLEKMKRENFMLYLLYEGEEVVGRFNINKIERGYVEIGYRVGERWCNRGIGSRGLNLLIEEVRKIEGIKRIRAFVERDNIPSVKMLKRNGFIIASGEIEEVEDRGKTLVLEMYYLEV